MGIKRGFSSCNTAGRGIYATVYLDHHRITEAHRCQLYVSIIEDHEDHLQCQLVHPDGDGDPDATYYISKDVIGMIRVEDRVKH